jgi:hypothetical protein
LHIPSFAGPVPGHEPPDVPPAAGADPAVPAVPELIDPPMGGAVVPAAAGALTPAVPPVVPPAGMVGPVVDPAAGGVPLPDTGELVPPVGVGVFGVALLLQAPLSRQPIASIIFWR